MSIAPLPGSSCLHAREGDLVRPGDRQFSQQVGIDLVASWRSHAPHGRAGLEVFGLRYKASLAGSLEPVALTHSTHAFHLRGNMQPPELCLILGDAA